MLQVHAIVLVAHDGAPRLGRVVAVRLPSFCKVEWPAADGPEVVRVALDALLAVLSLPAADLPAAVARLAAARARTPADAVETAWSLLLGQPCGTGEVAQLLYGAQGPAERDDALLVAGLDDDAFRLDRSQLLPRSPDERQALRTQRQRRAELDAQLATWDEALRHLATGRRLANAQRDAMSADLLAWLADADRGPVTSGWVERKGCTGAEASRAVRELLVLLGTFDPHDDPAVLRHAATLPDHAFSDIPPSLPADLPHSELPWVTIDNDDPHEIDDAVHVAQSGDGYALAVAIAYPALWFGPEHPVDRAARARGATLYHPRTVCPMLCDRIGREVASLVAGAWRPALVFQAEVTADGTLRNPRVAEQWVRVRWAWRYSAVDTWLAGEAGDPDQVACARLLWQFAQLREQRRIADGAWLLYRPEVDVRAPRFGAVRILDASQSSPARRVVTELMIAAGVAAGQLGRDLRLALPYRCQPPPHKPPLPPGLYTDAAQVAHVLRATQPSSTLTEPGGHSLMAVPHYVQVTSPLRRYSDIIAHRQFAAHLRGRRPVDAAQVQAWLAECEPEAARLRSWQRTADRYFKLLLLAGHGQGRVWQAQVVRPLAAGVLAFVPELALDVPLRSRTLPVGQWCTLLVRGADPGRDRLEVAVV
ncbi:MAG: RNB domain-containing ribonuclease [Deltaproteobacteria bacterium]|nr:RNB domain-containing ribonuclease [Deltaproteobacteria bacterium]